MKTVNRESERRAICDLRKFASTLIKNIVILVKVLYELIRCLFAHNAPNHHQPLSLLSRIATTKRSGKEHHSNGREQNLTVFATLLSCSSERLQVMSDVVLWSSRDTYFC